MKDISFEDLAAPREYRWPKRGDRLFAPADFPAEAEIHGDATTRFAFMMDGYKDAADVLVEEAVADRLARHGLIYPIVFCYRQFLELSLKWQIASYGTHCGVSRPGNTHDLKRLLRDFRMVCRFYGGGDTETLVSVSKCILEFALFDATSFTFRYPADKSGAAYPVGADGIDLERLRDVMEGIGNFFRGCDGYFDHLQGAMPY